MAKNWYPMINEESCVECGSCVEKCTHGVYDKSVSSGCDSVLWRYKYLKWKIKTE
jgi:ferredoxin